MTQEQMRQKALTYISEIHSIRPDMELPELSEDYQVTWETLSNLALILGSLRALSPLWEVAP